MTREEQVKAASRIMELLDNAIRHSRKTHVKEDIIQSQRLLLSIMYPGTEPRAGE